ncbi:hypothetical protein UCREL1_3047 [Eutypa lata UCREL1]|uniref:Uncharacterized protein n=1 Tax=Eutypa lata (strain UCR-EL1) TaxID=1287681 RepID=M7T022_EUTLA|nr:hypothetical protein UCREL1_3047 [Eutypa lata UCREL1]
MIGLLENLMEEFGGKLDELNLGFTEFLTSYWGPRMHDVLAELHAAELTEEEMRAAESIGVTWHDESPSLEELEEELEEESEEELEEESEEELEEEELEEEELEEEEEEEEEQEIISRDQMEYWVRELNKIVERNGIPPIS